MTNEEKILQRLDQLTAEMAGMKSEMSEMKTTLTRVAVTQENVVLPKLQLLAEGHVTLQEQIKKLSVIDSMQDLMPYKYRVRVGRNVASAHGSVD